MPPTVPARTLLCGGADVLACKIRFSPEIEATRNGWCAWAPGRAALAVHYAVREEGAGSCAWGVMPSPLHAVRMKRFGHLVPFRPKRRPRPRCGSRRRQARARRAGRAYAVCVHRCGLLRMGRHAVAAPRGSNEKVWPPCSFSNKEPSKTNLQGSPTTATAAFKDAAYSGGLCCVRACVCAACMLVSVQALAARPT